ncbi:BON domain-containing protein [Chitinophaga skermanii]|uniref:BON domain-containing protein n=1 Tax=Chitinophaga skermanii TaxID=331697 RepID=A0A327QJH0_9BACT|nr:BON domain-containing protein [Chitinophaga skermanii]RAJ03874.1 BON domain-containing protein [Chitinophaga skermanii]
MKKNSSIFIACMALMGILLYACKPSDAQLQKDVTTKVSAVTSGVAVEVAGGIATLSGEVPDDVSKSMAEDAAKGVKGITSVNNNITVAAPIVAPEPSVPVSINPDDILRNTIDSSFKAAGYTGITVAVANGEVTLSGEAPKADLKKIMQVANEAKPKKVKNQLTLK